MICKNDVDSDSALHLPHDHTSSVDRCWSSPGDNVDQFCFDPLLVLGPPHSGDWPGLLARVVRGGWQGELAVVVLII